MFPGMWSIFSVSCTIPYLKSYFTAGAIRPELDDQFQQMLTIGLLLLERLSLDLSAPQEYCHTWGRCSNELHLWGAHYPSLLQHLRRVAFQQNARFHD